MGIDLGQAGRAAFVVSPYVATTYDQSIKNYQVPY